MKLGVTVVVASVCLLAAEAQASSGYGNSLASPSFRYVYVENVRKAFVDAEQSRSYMASHDRELKLRFLEFQTSAEKAIADARKAGTPVGSYDLFLPAVRLQKPADVTKIDRKAYPLNLVLDVSDDKAQAHFEVTATKPWTSAQMTSLTTALRKIATSAPNDNQSEERTKREKAMLDAAAFAVPIAVTHVDDRFALYVGTVTEVASKDRAGLLAALQAKLDKLVPSLRTNLAMKDVTTRLGVTALNPVKKPIDNHPQKLPGAFHPWGPLVSGDLVRMNLAMGNVDVILMIAPKGKYDWGKTSAAMTTILRDAGIADAHRDLIEQEANRLGGERR